MTKKSTTQDEQKKLKAFLKRRHPEYAGLEAHWAFLSETYEGGRGWFGDNIFRYVKEGDREFEDRLKRAYRFNHTREVVDLVNKHLFRQPITRSEDAPESLRRFWGDCTQNGLTIDEFVNRVSNRSSIFGRPWVVVDTNVEGQVTQEELNRGSAKVYAYIVEPQNVLDMGYNDDTTLSWILLRETTRDDADPIESSGALSFQYRLWTASDWRLFRIEGTGSNARVVADAPVPHHCGRVPVIPADCFASDELYSSHSLIDDAAYMDRAVANYLSNLDAIIQDQTFSQLAMPAQSVPDESTAYNKLVEMGTKRIFLYDGEGGMPAYISPDVKQAELIMQIINKVISEIYHTVGLAGERTKDDNSQGIDNSSGVAKAYDFERVNSLLLSKAAALEQFENRMAAVVMAWCGEPDFSGRVVKYPDDFNTRGLYDEFDIAARLTLIEAPDEVRRRQMHVVVEKLFPMLREDLKEKMLSAVEKWESTLTAASAPSNEIAKVGKNSLANTLVKE